MRKIIIIIIMTTIIIIIIIITSISIHVWPIKSFTILNLFVLTNQKREKKDDEIHK